MAGGLRICEPIQLSAQSEIFLHYTYDNSAANPRNPNQPPKRIRFGLQATDEMGELWLQALVPGAQGRALLVRDYFADLARKTEHFDRFRLRLDPNNVEAHVRLGHDCLAGGRTPEAVEHLTRALQIQPENGPAHRDMALVHLAAGRLVEAETEFNAAIKNDPYDSEAFGNLGYIYANTGRQADARAALEQALRINPDDSTAAALLRKLPER